MARHSTLQWLNRKGTVWSHEIAVWGGSDFFSHGSHFSRMEGTCFKTEKWTMNYDKKVVLCSRSVVRAYSKCQEMYLGNRGWMCEKLYRKAGFWYGIGKIVFSDKRFLTKGCRVVLWNLVLKSECREMFKVLTSGFVGWKIRFWFFSKMIRISIFCNFCSCDCIVVTLIQLCQFGEPASSIYF